MKGFAAKFVVFWAIAGSAIYFGVWPWLAALLGLVVAADFELDREKGG